MAEAWNISAHPQMLAHLTQEEMTEDLENIEKAIEKRPDTHLQECLETRAQIYPRSQELLVAGPFDSVSQQPHMYSGVPSSRQNPDGDSSISGRSRTRAMFDYTPAGHSTPMYPTVCPQK